MTRLIRTTPALENACEALALARTVAVDTEFHSERRYYPELMLIQLRCDDGEPMLVDPLADIDLTPLGQALAQARVVVHGGQTDVQVLARALGTPLHVQFDTQIAAGCVGSGFPVRLQELTRIHLGRHMPKGETLSDWSQRPLSAQQLGYAADDVLVLGPLEAALQLALEARGTTEIAAHLLEEQLAIALAPEVDEDAWRSVAGAQVLEGPDRAIARELAAWRQSEARRRDVPRHSIVADAILTDLARRAPTNMESLRANRRMPTNVWKREGEAILSAILRGRDAPPVPPLHPRPRAWMDLVRAAGRVVEARLGVAVDLLLPDRVVTALAGRQPIDSWRKIALGPDFFAFLEGTSRLEMPAPLRFVAES
jgi:ribonuclease D